MAVTVVNKDNFKAQVLDQKGVVLVDFYADWCGPCKVTSPIIDGLSDEMKNVRFVKVDVDQNPDLASQYSIFSIPTFLIIKDGKIASQIVGARGKESFIEELKKAAP